MCELDETIVTLSDYSLFVSIPEPLGSLLGRIAEAGPEGISSIRLEADGYDRIHESISNLRHMGAVIYEERKHEHSWNGDQPKGVTHFTYQGWFVLTSEITPRNDV